MWLAFDPVEEMHLHQKRVHRKILGIGAMFLKNRGREGERTGVQSVRIIGDLVPGRMRGPGRSIRCPF